MNITHKLVASCAIAFASATSPGCSLIGYAVGGAIDGHDNYSLDSVAIDHSAGEPARPADSAKFATLMKEALLREKSLVEVVTKTETIVTDGLASDTVLVLRSEGSSREGLLPGEGVTLLLKDSALTRISGKVRRLKVGYILLELEGRQRGFPFNVINTIYLNDERVVTAQDLSSPQFPNRLIRLPSIVLGEGVRTRYIPFQDVVLIRVAQKINWGTARIIGFAFGAGLDVVAVAGMLTFAAKGNYPNNGYAW